MKTVELLKAVQRLVNDGLGESQVFVDTPVGALPIDELGGSHDTFEGIFVSLRGRQIESTFQSLLQPLAHKCRDCSHIAEVELGGLWFCDKHRAGPYIRNCDAACALCGQPHIPVRACYCREAYAPQMGT